MKKVYLVALIIPALMSFAPFAYADDATTTPDVATTTAPVVAPVVDTTPRGSCVSNCGSVSGGSIGAWFPSGVMGVVPAGTVYRPSVTSLDVVGESPSVPLSLSQRVTIMQELHCGLEASTCIRTWYQVGVLTQLLKGSGAGISNKITL